MKVGQIAVFTGVLLVGLVACAKDKAVESSALAAGDLPVWTYSTKSDEARKRVEAGEHFADNNEYVKAYEQFKRAVAADSAFGYAYARVAETSPSPDEYAVNVARAEAYAATANETERLLIQFDRKSLDNDQEGAIDLLKQLTVKEPKNPRSFLYLAFRQEAIGKIAECRASYQKAMDLAPTAGVPVLNLGYSYIFDEPKDFAKADQYVSAGVKLAPASPLSYFTLGHLRRAQNRLEEAAAAYTQMIALDPKDAQGYGYRGNANIFLGQYDKARADWDAAIRASRNTELAGNTNIRTLISAYAGDVNASIAEMEQLVQAYDGMPVTDPDFAKATVYLGEITLAAYHHKFDVADKALVPFVTATRRSFTKAGSAGLKISGEVNIAYYEGLVAAFKGDYARAEQKAAEIVKLRDADRDPTKGWPVHGLRGLSALFQKKYAVAVTEFSQADPGYDQLIAYHKALALEGAGKADEAKALFKSVAVHNFVNPQTAAVRADAIAKVASLK